MARLSRRFSRYFSLSRRSTQIPTSPKISKSQISKPILSDDDTRSLLASSHAHAHSHSSSQYTISDEELRALEEEKLSRRLEDAIDDILASYQNTSASPPRPAGKKIISSSSVDPFADPTPTATAQSQISSPNPSCSSVYSSPPPSPPTISAKLERFRDTPPPAPGWEKVDFGRHTRLFGPEGFVDFAGGGQGRVHGRGRKDWKGEFGRRGYAVL